MLPNLRLSSTPLMYKSLDMTTHPLHGKSRLWPIELVENIIDTAWSSSLSNTERTHLFHSLCLVNRAWLSILMQFALKDVYVPSSAFAEHYLVLLHQRNKSEADNNYLLDGASELANKLCRSITFRVESNPSNPMMGSSGYESNGNDNAEAISNLLYMIDALNYVPNLRRVRVEYDDTSFDDLYNQGRLISFPQQITHLELKYTATSQIAYSKMSFPAMTLPSITMLSAFGIPAVYLPSLVGACSNLQELVIEDLASTPPSLPDGGYTFAMYDPKLAKASWTRVALHVTLAERLFPKSEAKSRIVLRSNRGDVATQEEEEIKKLCESSGVEFVSISAGR